jgi:hypothetical protein
MLRRAVNALHWQKGSSMTDRKTTTPAQVKSDKAEHPKRGPEPDTLEGPADRHESEGVSDAPDNVTRRGEQ